MTPMRITVLLGGPSDEHDISVISGKAVADGLRSMGHDVFESDIGPDNLSALDHPADVIFPVLHGRFGESGELQEILEKRNLPFVGSGSRALRLGMDKVAAKEIWQQAGLPTPRWKVYQRPSANGVFAPCVVKPIDSGSSIGVCLCKEADVARTAIAKLVITYGKCLVEQYIKGPELTVGLLEDKALAPIRIISQGEFFDNHAKYYSDATEHRFDTGLPPAVVERCQRLAEHASAALGARDLGALTSCSMRPITRICWRSTRCRASRPRACCRRRPSTPASNLARWWTAWRPGI